MASLTFTNYSSEKLTNFLLDIMRRKENRKLWRLFFPLFLWRMQFSSCMQLLGQNWSIVRPEIDTFAQFSLFNNWCHKSYCTLYSRGCKKAEVAWFYFNSQIVYPFFNLTDFSWSKNGLFLRFIFSWVAFMVSYNTLLCIAIWVEIVS